MGAWILDLNIAPTPHIVAKVAAHAAAIALYTTRMTTFPPQISSSFLLAVLEEPAAIVDLAFVTTVAPNLANRIRPWSNDVSKAGPFRNSSHPNYWDVRVLADLYTDTEVRGHVSEDA